MANKKVITSINSRLGKRGKRELFSFSGVEAQEHIDEYMAEVRMTKTDLENYQSNASASAKSAAESAEQAEQSATDLAESVASASASAAKAEICMNAASDSASAAANSEANAAAYAQRTSEVEETLTQAENTVAEAKEVAKTIEQKIAGANDAAEMAVEAANTATKKANAASSSAASAASSAETATKAAEDMTDAMETCKTAAEQAATSATNAGSSATSAQEYAEAAQKSAEQAGAAATGVSSWNRRGGAVVPQSGDYTASLITTASGSDVETELGNKASQADLTDLQNTVNDTVNKRIGDLQTNLDTVAQDLDTVEGNLNTVSGYLTDTITKLTTLIGEYPDKSAYEIALIALTKALVPEDAKASLDTIAEIAAWIQSHPDDAAAMNEQITALQTKMNSVAKSISISGTTMTITMMDGTTHTLKTQDTTYSEATTTKAGLMSAADKTKLDGMDGTRYEAYVGSNYANYGWFKFANWEGLKNNNLNLILIIRSTYLTNKAGIANVSIRSDGTNCSVYRFEWITGSAYQPKVRVSFSNNNATFYVYSDIQYQHFNIKAVEVSNTTLLTLGGTFTMYNSTTPESTEPSGTDIGNGVVDLIYPVGSIYLSVSSTSPATLFGGTWVQLKDRFLIGAGNSYSVNATGGATTHTLTTAEMPSHTHTFSGTAKNTTQVDVAHTHTFSATSGSSGAHTHSGFLPGIHPRTKSDSGAWGMITSLLGTWQGITSSALSGSTTTSDNVYGTANITIPSAGAHTHSVSGTTGSNNISHYHKYTPEGTNSSTGSGSAHSIMNPYLAVYMWKRTA